MVLFTAQITNWQDWGKIFQSIPEFSLLAKHILKKEGLPLAPLEKRVFLKRCGCKKRHIASK